MAGLLPSLALFRIRGGHTNPARLYDIQHFLVDLVSFFLDHSWRAFVACRALLSGMRRLRCLGAGPGLVEMQQAPQRRLTP